MSRVLAGALGWLVLGAGVLAPRAASAAPPPPVRWVTDQAAFLSEAARSSLDARLEAYQRETGHHVLVWIDRTTGEVPIEDFAVRAFEAWRVGRKGVDDGLVLFVFADDRRVRVEVGYGLEGPVPDAIASRVVREVILPRIASGDRDGAVLAGVDALVSAIDGKAPAREPTVTGPSTRRATPSAAPRPLNAAQKVLIVLAGIAFLILFLTNPSLALYLLFSILSGGRGGGGSGGGSGYSGGGGRSGGGGASGSW